MTSGAHSRLMFSYSELHCHSCYSLLDGASTPEELAAQARALGMGALALTDHDAVYGAVRFAEAAQEYGIRPIFGAELSLSDGHHLTLLVADESGWRNLCRLISYARHNAAKGHAALDPEALAGHADGLIALSGCRSGELAAALLRGDRQAALAAASRYRELFGAERFWIELQQHLLPDDHGLLEDQVALARELELGYVATNNVHYATRERRRLQDALVCMRQRTTLDEAGPLLRPNSEYYLKPASRMAPLFAAYPEALGNTQRIVDLCGFQLRAKLQDLPVFPTSHGLSAIEELRRLCRQATAALPPSAVYPIAAGEQQLEHELQVIEQAGLANYFLIVWDIVRFCRARRIRCQGRGSAANSLVAYLLGISPVNPLEHNLVFERFLSAERRIVPDIDIDFQADRREEVIQYLYERYGREHAAMACTVVTFRSRSAIRDIGKALGMPGDLIARAAQKLELREERAEAADDSALALLLELCSQIDGLPRHLGIHNGGMLLTGAPLVERIATEPAGMPGRVVAQWDKAALEAAGLIKIDILGLRMLSLIAEALEICEAAGARPELDRLSFDDPAVYELIASADTIGVFQVESRAQAQILPRLQPRCFADLAISISLIRPGPLQGQMVHPYLRRRLGLEPVSYLHPLLREALAETLGVILFQEQVLKVARDLAGFSPGQGEQLRRALGSKRAAAELGRFRRAFLDGAQSRGVPEETAAAIFSQLEAFGGYSFAKSHAVAFAVLVYQSAWLKLYHQAAFYAALLNNQPMGFWSPAVIVGDARRHGVPILPVDLEHSRDRCTVEAGGVRLGLRFVDGLGEAAIARLEQARQRVRPHDLASLCRQTRLPRRAVENLIMAGALDSWGVPRRELIWELGALHYREQELDLLFPAARARLPSLSRAQALAWEQAVLGLSSAEHMLALYRPWLDEQGAISSRDLAACADGRRVWLAGLLVLHQAPPTARGHHFLTLEDEDGLVNVILRPQVATTYRWLLRSARALVVDGRVQHSGGVLNLLAERIAAFDLRDVEVC